MPDGTGKGKPWLPEVARAFRTFGIQNPFFHSIVLCTQRVVISSMGGLSKRSFCRRLVVIVQTLSLIGISEVFLAHVHHYG